MAPTLSINVSDHTHGHDTTAARTLKADMSHLAPSPRANLLLGHLPMVVRSDHVVEVWQQQHEALGDTFSLRFGRSVGPAADPGDRDRPVTLAPAVDLPAVFSRR